MKPYVICHILTSADGRITGELLSTNEALAAADVYYEINRTLVHSGKICAFGCGRITMEGSFTAGYYPDLSGYVNNTLQKDDYIATRAKFYAVAFDRCGKLGWRAGVISDPDDEYDRAHVIEVLTKRTPTEYLSYLREIGTSYIFAGENDVDVSLALEKLHSLFEIELFLLEGGSIINGAFSRADAIDEYSLVVAPVCGGSDGAPLLSDGRIASMKLKEIKKYENDIIYLNYERNRTK